MSEQAVDTSILRLYKRMKDEAVHIECLLKNLERPVIHKAQYKKKEPSVLRLFKIVRMLARTDPIFNMADRLMNIHDYSV